jgi:hypothetical protein
MARRTNFLACFRGAGSGPRRRKPRRVKTKLAQKHTVRGLVSILGHQGGAQIESTKNSAGERTYMAR